MIRAIIFDLDNCLSAADEPGKGLLEPIFDAIRRVNHGRLSDEALAEAFSDCWRHPLDFVAKKPRSRRTCSPQVGLCMFNWKWPRPCAVMPIFARCQNSRSGAFW